MRQTFGKARLPLWVLIGATVLLLAGLATACNSQLKPATIAMMDEAEARWQENPVLSYRIVVDVERPDDRRRNELIVEQGQVTRALIRYWDPERQRWGRPMELTIEQAQWFTVPGLFNTVREELRNSGRKRIRVAIEGDPAFPRRIELGPVMEGKKPAPYTKATVIVRVFEPLLRQQ